MEQQQQEQLKQQLKQQQQQKKEVIIYSDGGCIGNPGRGGYGTVLLYGAHRKELSAGFLLTTNNRMELLAAITGLEALKEACIVTLYTDSMYVINGITQGWARGWQAGNWRRGGGGGEVVPNWDLWERLLQVVSKHRVTFQWVKGHAGNIENERCDELARLAANLPTATLTKDEVYANSTPPPSTPSPIALSPDLTAEQLTLSLKEAAKTGKETGGKSNKSSKPKTNNKSKVKQNES